MSTHKICLYKEIDKNYTVCNLKTRKLPDCELIGVCAVIRSNTVCLALRLLCCGRGDWLLYCSCLWHVYCLACFVCFSSRCHWQAIICDCGYPWTSSRLSTIVRNSSSSLLTHQPAVKWTFARNIGQAWYVVSYPKTYGIHVTFCCRTFLTSWKMIDLKKLESVQFVKGNAIY